LGQSVGGQESGEGGGDAGEEGVPLGLLGELPPFPGLADRLGVGQDLVAEDVGVALYHFPVDAVDDL
jgi:hypothetical protein